MVYLRWNTDEIRGLEELCLSYVVTECSSDGSVQREVGFTSSGEAVHRAPDPQAKSFLFDLQVIALPEKPESCMSAQEFAAAWRSVGLPPNNSFKPNPLRGSA